MSTSSHLDQARAFWVVAPEQGKIRSVCLPQCTQGDVKVRTLFSAISLGTESLVYKGSVPVSEYQRMRAPFQQGEFTFPVKYGYINIGVIEDGPAESIGQQVFCLYPHQTHYVIPLKYVTPLPANIPAERAILCANMETALNVLWDAAPCIGDHITVVGAGVLGCLVAWLAAQIPGCNVELVDINPGRADIAETLGTEFRLPVHASNERDLVIHASASEQGLNLALRLAAFESTVVELSWYGAKAVSVDLGGAFHSKRLQIRSSQVGHVATPQRARWDYQRRLDLALSLLTDPRLDQLITGESHFDELPATFDLLMGKSRNTLCQRIRYD